MSQPFRGEPKKRHRTYVPAEWADPGTGGGHPKLSGGFYIDPRTGNVTPRALNRADQRYTLEAEELQNRRLARALVEYDDTVIAQAENTLILCKAVSGNVYRLSVDGIECECPDYWRLTQSGQDTVSCKHRIIAEQKLTEAGGYISLPWSSWKLAEWMGVALSTAEAYFHKGIVPGVKVNGIWLGYPTGEFMMAAVDQLAKIPDLPLPDLGDLTAQP